MADEKGGRRADVVAEIGAPPRMALYVATARVP
jgi:hypothetical protein